jgi:alpha-D-ribose 1-methylphosphonate 5-triphosphate synthase subunit PhnH
MNHGQFPLGVDVVFVTGDRLAALPRSTAASIEVQV